MVSLDVGPDATRFDIHGTVLCQSTELAAKFDPWSLKKQPVPLPELDEAAAHTLVHYLYTGKYQALQTNAQTDKATSLNYKLGTCVYCAAVRYKLPGLAELAKEKIISFGEDVSVFDVLSMARDCAFPLLPEDDAWYPAYLEEALKSAMVDNPEPFREPQFITQVEGNSRLLQLVWKTVMSSYVRGLVATGDVVETPTAKIDQTEAAAVDVQLAVIPGLPNSIEQSEPHTEFAPSLDDSVNLPSASTENVAVEPETTFEDPFELEDIEPSVDTPQAPEPFTDELGFLSSKTYRQMGKKADVVVDVDQAEEAPTKPLHTRSDSVLQVEESAPKEESEMSSAEAISSLNEISPLITETNAGVAQAKKNKKLKKKKTSSIVFH